MSAPLTPTAQVPVEYVSGGLLDSQCRSLRDVLLGMYQKHATCVNRTMPMISSGRLHKLSAISTSSQLFYDLSTLLDTTWVSMYASVCSEHPHPHTQSKRQDLDAYLSSLPQARIRPGTHVHQD